MIDFVLSKKQAMLKEGINNLGRYVIRPMSLQMDRAHDVPEPFMRNFMAMAKSFRGSGGALTEFDDSDDLLPAVVLEATPKQVRAYLRGGEVLKIGEDGLKFAARMIDDKAPPNKRLRRGAVIRVQKFEKGWQILQLPDVEAAFVAASPVDGSIRALVGGFDFNRKKFNHVTSAWRQPGSSIKPFIYSAALHTIRLRLG